MKGRRPGWLRAVVGVTVMGLVTVALLAALDAAVGLARQIHRSEDNRFSDSLVPAEIGREETLAYARVRYQPFTVWSYRPFAGQHITIDAQGYRSTPTSAPAEAAKVQLFLFGGSTMLGQGSADRDTIPSHLCRLLNDADSAGGPYRCINLGVGGYMSTQEVVQLLRLLERDQRPGIVVFYDGANDVLAALQGTPGDHHGTRDIAAIYESYQQRRLRHPVLAAIDGALAGLGSTLPATNLVWLAGRVSRVAARPVATLAPTDDDVRKAVDVYFTNVQVVCGMAAAMGFRAVLAWQPTIFAKAALSEPERRIMAHNGAGVEGFRAPWTLASRLWDEARERTKRARDPAVCRVVDLAEAVRARTDTVFFDWHHVVPLGNRLVAMALYQTLSAAGWLRQ